MYTVLHMRFLTDWVNLFLDISYVFEVCELLCFQDAIHFDAVHHPVIFFKKNLTKFHKYSNTGRGFKLVFSKVVTVTYKRTLCMCTKYRKYESTKKIKNKKIQLQYIVVCINKILRQTLNTTK